MTEDDLGLKTYLSPRSENGSIKKGRYRHLTKDNRDSRDEQSKVLGQQNTFGCREP